MYNVLGLVRGYSLADQPLRALSRRFARVPRGSAAIAAEDMKYLKSGQVRARRALSRLCARFARGSAAIAIDGMVHLLH